MKKQLSLASSSRDRSGRLYLMIAIAIFGAANAVIRKLTDLGAENLIGGDRNPISFCNVLFVGNLCALIIFWLIHHRDWRKPLLRQINLRQWLTLTVVAVLSAAVVPTLVFTALSITAVNNVILIGQIDTPLVLALSVLVLGDRLNAWVIAGATLAFVGVALTVLIPAPGGAAMMDLGMGLQIGLGEVLTLLAAVLKAIANLISKVSLRQIPLGIFNVFRMLVGTIFFFVAASVLYGPAHFMDVSSSFLWKWMLFYGTVIVVGGQLAWFIGLTKSTASEVSLATAFNPLTGVLAAYLLLAELPTLAQYIGGGVILLGIALNQIGVRQLNRAKVNPPPTMQEKEESVTFQGI